MMSSNELPLRILGKFFIKLQNLGILELDYINTTENINSLNVERLHITLFYNELLKKNI